MSNRRYSFYKAKGPKNFSIPYDKERAETIDDLIKSKHEKEEDQLKTLFGLLPKQLSEPQLGNFRDLTSFNINAGFELYKQRGWAFADETDEEAEPPEEKESPKTKPKTNSFIYGGLRFRRVTRGVVEINDPMSRYLADSRFEDGTVQCDDGSITELAPGEKTFPNGHDLHDLFTRTLSSDPSLWLAAGKRADFAEYHNGNVEVPVDDGDVAEKTKKRHRDETPERAQDSPPRMTYETEICTDEEVNKIVEEIKKDDTALEKRVRNYRQVAETKIEEFKTLKQGVRDEDMEKTVSDYIRHLNGAVRKPTKPLYAREYSCELMRAFFLAYAITFTVEAIEAIEMPSPFHSGLVAGYFPWLDKREDEGEDASGDGGD